MKYFCLILLLCPFFLSAMTEDEAIAEQLLVSQEVAAIRDQNPDARDCCAAIKAWRTANQSRLDAIEEALQEPAVEVAAVQQDLVLPEGTSEEECEILKAQHELQLSLCNLRKSQEGATAVERCEAVKQWREANKELIEKCEILATEFQAAATLNVPQKLLTEGMGEEERQVIEEVEAIQSEIASIREQNPDAKACCAAIKAWRIENVDRLKILEKRMKSL